MRVLCCTCSPFCDLVRQNSRKGQQSFEVDTLAVHLCVICSADSSHVFSASPLIEGPQQSQLNQYLIQQHTPQLFTDFHTLAHISFQSLIPFLINIQLNLSFTMSTQVRRRANHKLASRERSRAGRKSHRDHEEGEMAEHNHTENPYVYEYLKFQTHQHINKGKSPKRRAQKVRSSQLPLPSKRSKRIIDLRGEDKNQNIQMTFLPEMIQEFHLQHPDSNRKEGSIMAPESKQSERVSVFHSQNDLNIDHISKFVGRYEGSLFLGKEEIRRDLKSLKGKCAEGRAEIPLGREISKEEMRYL